MKEQDKMDELFEIVTFVENGHGKEARKHLRHKPYQKDFGGKENE